MKKRKEIEKELGVRRERIKQIRTFGSKDEVNYERGYIDCLRWILENFKNLKVSKDRIAWKRIFESANNVNYDEGCRKAIDWSLDL